MADQLLDLTAFAPSSEPVLDLEQFAPPKPAPAKKPGILIPSVKRTAGQMVGATGVALEDLGLKTRLPEAGEAIVEANPAQIQKPSDILEKPGTFVGESVSEMLPQLGAYAAGAWGGAKVGGRLGAFLGPKGAALGAVGGGIIGGLAPIFTQEYGEIRGIQKKEGTENIPKALLGATAATALERLGAEKLVGRIVKGGGMDLIKEGVSRPLHVLKQGAIGALVEGPLTEAPQTAIERLAGGAPLADEEAMADYIISAAKGAAGGGVVTGALSGLAKREQPPAPTEAPPESVPAAEAATTGPAEPLGLSEFIKSTRAPEAQAPMGATEFVRANRAQGVEGPVKAAEVKAARAEYEAYKQAFAAEQVAEYEAYKQAFINEQFGVQPLTLEQRNQILINQTPLEAPAPPVAPAPEAPTAFQQFPAEQAKVVVAPDQLELEDISPAPVESAAAPVQKTRIAEPVILGEHPTPAPAVPIITPQEAEFLRIAETEAAIPVAAEVQSDPATKVALLKRQRGELLTNREAKLVRDYEKTAPKVEAQASETTPKFRGRQFGSAERRENFVNAYSRAVDSALADLVAQGVAISPNKLKRATSLLKRSAEAAVVAENDAAGAAVLDAEMGKALRGIIPKAEIEIFRQKLADAAQAALPETLSSRAAVDDAIIAKSDEIINTLVGMIGTPKDLVVEVAPRVMGGAGMIQFGQLRDVITVSVQAVDAGSTAAHEGFHYLDKRVLTGPERRVVRQAFASGSKLHRMLVAKAEAYDSANGTDIASEIRAIPAEARAYGFEFWRRGELEAKGMIAKVFQKLARVMERIRNYIDGLGFTSYEDLFAMIRRGEYAKRDLSGIREFEREVMRSRAQREASEKAFYSALTEAVADIRKVAGKDGMIAPAQAKAWLTARQKEGRFKVAELEAVGLAEWLDLQPGKVSVDDIETFVREYGVQVEETMLEAVKFSDYQLPGGENYRELLLRLPGGKPIGSYGEWLAKKLGVTESEAEDSPEYEDDTLHAQFMREEAQAKRSFHSSHFDQPNVLAHIRFNERTDADGKRVLFLEEIQSDWAQKGRKEGFKAPAPDRAEFAATGSGGGWWAVTRNGQPQGKFHADSAEAAVGERIAQIAAGSGVLSAPFVTETKAWVALALKRMIRYAAEHGFDRVAWTTGEQQAERYDLSKRIMNVAYSGTNFRAFDHEGNEVISQTGVRPEDLPDLIGKDAAEKLMAQEPQGTLRVLSGQDLKVGGEGMNAFYDKIVPQVANELLKKFGGGKVGEVRLAEVRAKQGNYIERGNGGFEVFYADGSSYGVYPTRESAGVALAKIERTHPSPAPDVVPTTAQPGFDITPALRGEAMAGLPLFSKAATESIQDIARKMAEGDLQREQVNAHLAAQLDRPDMRDMTERLAERAGFELSAIANSIRRGYHAFIGSGENRARASAGYRNVFNVMTHYQQRKSLIFERAIAKDLSTWVKGASRQDKVAVSKAMLTATVGSYSHDMPEYQALRNSLTTEQRAMMDQAWGMIGKMLDAEFEADARKYRKIFADDAKFEEWFANRKAQVDQLKKQSYFPERRYGDHFVHAYVEAPDGKPITIYYEQYEREAGATSAKVELEKIFGAEGLKVEYGFKHKAEYDGSLSIGQFLDLAQRHGISLTQPEKERLGKALIAADSTRRNRIFRRQNVAGYSQDGMRVLAEFAVSMANKVAYSEMGDALQDALQGKQVDVAFTKEGTVTINTQEGTNVWDQDGPEAGFFRNLADEKVGFVMSPESRSTVSNKLRAMATVYFLGGSIAAAGVNMSSLPMITLPWLTQHTNAVNASAKLLDGMRVAGKHFKEISDLPTLLGSTPIEGVDEVAGLRHALQIAAQDGSLFDTEIYQFMGLSRGQEYSLSGRTQEAVKLWMTPFRIAEQYNRVSAFIAAYKVAKGNNLDNEAAFAQAQEAVYGTQFRYDEANRPALADSGVGSLFFVFKSFPIFMMETMTFLAKENPRSAVFMLGMLVLMAGVEGLPFAEDLEDLIDVIAQRLFGEPFNSKRWLRNTLKNASEAVVGADLSGVLMHGVANSLTGLSFASRVGAGNLVPGTRIGAADTDYRRAMEEILGPVGSMVSGIVAGGDALSKGDFLTAAKKGLPLAAKNAVKGWEQFEKGYATDAGGRKLVDVGSWEAFWQSVGFSSSALSQVYESDSIDRRTSAFYTEIKGQFTKEMVKAIGEGDRAAANEVGMAVVAWNKAHPDMPIAMSPASIRRQVALAGMPLNQRTLLTMPRYLRGQSEAAIGLAAE